MASVPVSTQDSPGDADAPDPKRMALERWRWVASKATGRVALIGPPNPILIEYLAERNVPFDVISAAHTDLDAETLAGDRTDLVLLASAGGDGGDQGSYDRVILSCPLGDHDVASELLGRSAHLVAPGGRILVTAPLGVSNPAQVPGWYVGRLLRWCRDRAAVDEVVVVDGGIRLVLAPIGSSTDGSGPSLDTIEGAVLQEEEVIEQRDRERLRLQDQVATLSNALLAQTARLDSAESEFVSETMRIRSDVAKFKDRIVAEAVARDAELWTARVSAEKLEAEAAQERNRIAAELETTRKRVDKLTAHSEVAQKRLDKARHNLERMRRRRWWLLGQELYAVRRRPMTVWRLPVRMLRLLRSSGVESTGSGAADRSPKQG